MSVQCVGIHWNSTKDTGIDVARRVVGLLERRGVEICVNDELARALDMPKLHVNAFDACRYWA